MEVKTTEWRAGPSVCRCCLTEGCYKDISTEYFWMGKREVYAEMLSEALSVTVSISLLKYRSIFVKTPRHPFSWFRTSFLLPDLFVESDVLLLIRTPWLALHSLVGF